MSPAGYAVILVLLVIFMTILLSAVVKKSTEKIITKTVDDSDFVEKQLRDILKKHPDSEIYIMNITKNAESIEITEKLCRDYPQIHIKD